MSGRLWETPDQANSVAACLVVLRNLIIQADLEKSSCGPLWLIDQIVQIEHLTPYVQAIDDDIDALEREENLPNGR